MDYPTITLKVARIIRGLTQRELANRLGISESTYIRWEKDPSVISVAKVDEISEVLGFPTDTISFLPKNTS